MQRNPSLILVATACVAVVPLWSVAHFAWSFKRQPAASGNANIELTGELIPAIAAFMDARNVELRIPPGTPVRRGDVIGIALAEDESQEQATARQELEAAREAWRLARTQSRRTQAELATLDVEAAELNREEVQSQVAGSPADSSDLARLSWTAIETDELHARAEMERGDLRDAAERLEAARATVNTKPSGPSTAAIVAPADGVLAAIDEPEGRKLGIASAPARLVVHAIAHGADLTRIRIGSDAAVILQTRPGDTLHAHVTAISTTPVEGSNDDYPVTLAADSPGRIWLQDVPVLVRIPCENTQ